jgi:hypothetical protein
MNLWYEYVNAWNSMYAKYIRNTRKMTESWFDSFSKFWSGRVISLATASIVYVTVKNSSLVLWNTNALPANSNDPEFMPWLKD